MKIHELKTDSIPFQKTIECSKRWEVRKNDRNFTKGDILVLRETKYTGEEMKAGKPLGYTGSEMTLLVLDVFDGYGIKDGYVIMSITCNRQLIRAVGYRLSINQLG